ncbi:MAG: quinoprotein dehydrogenase-associated SoxYZ-like carrier [Gammaproteobacteria bacterium]|jgi:sulfur-oxidizing protein SoxY|nr:quinoprotein dehydrogenase-associated SoxYZ-like carrier [Gammaproteobacteria bacterium]MBU0772029.1 quinoprotein dehydrogenase-associated SoxYZ-like carrier [Gammaproteobacteria bacterium]MBU0856422.1 quinoprotein dehydrogenase-associated SoxYZ-like carrier [Gammaproteobacteria bacterium]MBU1845821.1 quinoprotein dehydrogenase-associated SoxYZ-like carrier [Gammaproteobacteria bacterium]
MKQLFATFGLVLGVMHAVHAADADPLNSSRWPDLQERYLEGAPVVFDPRVEVIAPRVAEDSMNVPVTVRLKDMPDVTRVVVIADFNPIVKVLDFQPLVAQPGLSFRIKLQQASPIRALVQTSDGKWYAGGSWVDAAGGGCTAPSTGHGAPDWAEKLNQVQARVWHDGRNQRVRLRIMHPMDTGLAPGIPAFYIEQLAIEDEKGDALLRLETFEPLSENPVFSFDMPDTGSAPLRIVGRDNNGNRIDAKVMQ